MQAHKARKKLYFAPAILRFIFKSIFQFIKDYLVCGVRIRTLSVIGYPLS